MIKQSSSSENTNCPLDGFDLRNLQLAFNNDWQRITGLLLKFKESQMSYLLLIEQQLAALDYSQAKISLHSLKGISANVGAKFLAEAAAQLESECSTESVNPASLEKLRLEFARVMGSLASLSSLHI